MVSRGNGEDNINLLNKYGMKYNIVKTCPNSVRIGNVEGNKEPKKCNGNGPIWFPKSRTSNEIKKSNISAFIDDAEKIVKYCLEEK